MSRREFSVATRKAAHKRSGGFCECGCARPFTDHPKERPHYDHRVADRIGGANDLDNCRVLRVDCHLAKTAKEDMPRIKKVRRGEKARKGIERKKFKLRGGKWDKLKRKINGEVVER